MTCLIPGCDSETGAWPPACGRHWRGLPDPLKAAIRRTAPKAYERATPEYREVIAAAVAYFDGTAHPHASPPASSAADYAMALARRICGDRD